MKKNVEEFEKQKNTKTGASKKKTLQLVMVSLGVFVMLIVIALGIFFFLKRDKSTIENTDAIPVNATMSVEVTPSTVTPAPPVEPVISQAVEEPKEEEEIPEPQIPSNVLVLGDYTDQYDDSPLNTKTKKDFISVQRHDLTVGNRVFFLLVINYRDTEYHQKVSYDTWKNMPDNGIVIATIEYFMQDGVGIITDIRPDKNYKQILESTDGGLN